MKGLMLSKKHLSQSRRGVASVYIVMFASIVFGIVAISFTTIMLSESSQTSNDDLSQSAYDAALAGVEYARGRVKAYYECLGGPNPATCNTDGVFSPSPGACLEVNGKVSDTADQEFTCLVTTDKTPDFRGTLTSDNRTKVIPISYALNGINATPANQIAKIEFKWFSARDQAGKTADEYTVYSDDKLRDYDNRTFPSTIQLSLIRAKKTATTSAFNQPTGSNSGDRPLDSVMLLLPKSGADLGPTITSTAILNADSASQTNAPITVGCSSDSFACHVYLDTSTLFSSEDNAILVASLPYGDPSTDFAVVLYDADGNPIDFQGVQVSIDSTGRTANLFRRVETRIDRVDPFYPYITNALELTDDSDGEINKSFWITSNCWTITRNYNSGTGATCDQNGSL